MRDFARIPRIVEKLSRLWTAWPDMRLGQLLENTMAEAGRPVQEDIYDLEAWIDRWLERLPTGR